MAISTRKTKSAARLSIIPRDVREFSPRATVSRHSCAAAFASLAGSRFTRCVEIRSPVAGKIPDTDDQRIVVDVTVDCDIPAALSMKKMYTLNWVKVAPPQVRERIRLLYNFR